MVPLQEVEAALEAGQHAERQHVDLHQPDRVDVVLVPLDEGAVRHGAVAHRHGLVEPAAGQHEAADVLRQVAGEADQLVGEVERLTDRGVLRVEAGLAHVPVRHAGAPGAPDRVGDRRGHVLGQAQDLADLADRHARAVVDHRGAEGGPLPPVAGVEVLDHLLAALVLEIDVDVGRLAAVLRDEPGEEQPVLRRVHRGDAEAEAHGGIGRRAAALAEDALAAGELDHVEQGQEVAGVVHLGDEPQLLAERRRDGVRDLAGVAPARPLPGLLLQVFLRRAPGGHGLVRVLVTQLRQVEGAGLRDLDGAGQRLRVVGEQPRHLGRRLQVALGIGLQAVAGVLDPAAFADAGDHVLERAPVGMVVERVRDRDHRGAGGRAQLGEQPEAPPLVAAARVARPEEGPARGRGGQRLQPGPEALRQAPGRRHGDEHLPLRGLQHLGEGEAAIALADAPVAEGEQPAEAAPGLAVHRVGDGLEPLLGDEAHPRQDPDRGALRFEGAGRRVRAHHTGHGVAVGDADGLEAVGSRLRDEFLRVRGAVQEGEVRGDGELGVRELRRGHANSPWTYHAAGRSGACGPSR